MARSDCCLSSSRRLSCCKRSAAALGASSAHARNPSQRHKSPSGDTNRWPGFNKACRRGPSSASTSPIWLIRRANTSGTDTCADSGDTPAGRGCSASNAGSTVHPEGPSASTSGARKSSAKAAPSAFSKPISTCSRSMIWPPSTVSRCSNRASAVTSARSAFNSPSASLRSARTSASRACAAARAASASVKTSSAWATASCACSSSMRACPNCVWAWAKLARACCMAARAVSAWPSLRAKTLPLSSKNRVADWWRAANRATSSVRSDKSASRSCKILAASRAASAATSSLSAWPSPALANSRCSHSSRAMVSPASRFSPASRSISRANC